MVIRLFLYLEYEMVAECSQKTLFSSGILENTLSYLVIRLSSSEISSAILKSAAKVFLETFTFSHKNLKG